MDDKTQMPMWTEYVGRALAVTGYGYFIYRGVLAGLSHFSWVTLLFIIAESFTAFLLLFSRLPKDIERTPYNLVIAVGATFYYLFINLDGGVAVVPEQVALGLVIVGVCFSLYAKYHLGRSFALLPSNRGVVTSGPYRIVRHPIYLGYFVCGLGFILSHVGWINVVVFSGQYALQLLRIFAEERLLTKDPEYEAYTKTTRYRAIPGVF